MFRESPADTSIDKDKLYSRSAYIISVDQFLNETNPLKALHYWLTEFVPAASLKNPEDIIDAIQRSISDIDHIINDQVNAIIHQKQFQKIESSWRGLWSLTVQADGAKNIKIKVLDINWSEISRDISRALEFDQSNLFQKIYSEEYGTPGGEPYGVLIGDYEINTVLDLTNVLGKRIIGQKHALDAIAQAIRTSRAGLTDPRKPVGVFFLVGSSGVGKTETALALADLLYGGEQNITTINMSEFKEEHKVSMLLGSPPGYVGFGEGGVLTEAVRRKPYSVILLDEMEKGYTYKDKVIRHTKVVVSEEKSSEPKE